MALFGEVVAEELDAQVAGAGAARIQDQHGTFVAILLAGSVGHVVQHRRYGVQVEVLHVAGDGCGFSGGGQFRTFCRLAFLFHAVHVVVHAGRAQQAREQLVGRDLLAVQVAHAVGEVELADDVVAVVLADVEHFGHAGHRTHLVVGFGGGLFSSHALLFDAVLHDQVAHHGLGNDQGGIDLLDGLDHDLLRRQILDVGRIGQVQRKSQLAFALVGFPADRVDAESGVAIEQLAGIFQHGVELLVLQAFVGGAQHVLAHDLVVGVRQLLDGGAVQLGELDHGLAVAQRHVVQRDGAGLVGGFDIDVLVVFAQLDAVAQVVQRELDVVIGLGHVQALELDARIADGQAELAHPAVHVHRQAGHQHFDRVAGFFAIHRELFHQRVRRDGLLRAVEGAVDLHAAEVDGVAVLRDLHGRDIGGGGGVAAETDERVGGQRHHAIGQLEQFLDVVGLGEFSVRESQLWSDGAACQGALGEGAVFDGCIELDHACGQIIGVLVALDQRQAIARLRREQAALILQLIDAQTEQRRDLCQFFIGFCQMALRAFLDALAGVPRGPDPASRSHYDHAEGDRYALFHRSACIVDYRVIPGDTRLLLAAGRRCWRPPSEYAYSSACKARGEYTEADGHLSSLAVTEDFKMKAGALAPAFQGKRLQRGITSDPTGRSDGVRA